MSRPFRIEPVGRRERLGRLLDRSKPLRFSFDGMPYLGFEGDTLASALLANGVRLVGRSPRRHRPRGLVGIGTEEPNGFVSLPDAVRDSSDHRATMIRLVDGLAAETRKQWPGQSAGVTGSPWFQRAWEVLKPVRERLPRRIRPTSRSVAFDRARYEHLHVTCDVLVIGGGTAGLAAAVAASGSGAQVILAEQADRFGGQADLFGGTIEGESQIAWTAKTVAELAASDRAVLLPGTRAVMLDRDYRAILDERLDDGGRVWFVRAKRIVLATGSVERPLIFAGNDRPGVMFARAARAYAVRYSVAPGARGIVVTNNDDGYRTAELLKDSGVDILKLVDLRPGAESRAVDRVKTFGLPIRFGAGAVGIGTDASGTSVASVAIGDLLPKRRIGDVSEIACDFVLMSGGDAPETALYEQIGGRMVRDSATGAPRPETMIGAVAMIGAAAGAYALGIALDQGFCTGERFARESVGRAIKVSPGRIVESEDAPPGDERHVPGTGDAADGESHFVDFSRDMTVADVERARRNGHAHPPRNGAASDEPAALTKTLPSPVQPLTLAAIAGPRRGVSSMPLRRTPLHEWHEANGAVFETEGQFRQPIVYPLGTETREQAALREGKTACASVGLIDLSMLGRIEIAGSAAAELLRATFGIALPDIGSCRRVVLRNARGGVVDDGILANLDGNRFFLTASSGEADHTHEALKQRAQALGLQGRILLVPLGEALAHMALVGPDAPSLLARLGWTGDLARLETRTGHLAGYPVRVFRVGSTGGPSFEVSVAASLALPLWRAIADRGVTPLGSEAFSALRLEAGMFTIGRETDGAVSAAALGLGAGEASELVGLIVADGRRPFPIGTQIVSERKPRRILGRVTSSHDSPSFGRPLALALLEDGCRRIGSLVALVEPDGRERWAHVRPARFLEPAPEHAPTEKPELAPVAFPPPPRVPVVEIPAAALPDGITVAVIDDVHAIDVHLTSSAAHSTRIAELPGSADNPSALSISSDRWLILGPAAADASLVSSIDSAADGCTAIPGDGWTGLLLSGPRAESTLLRASTSDLTRPAFAPGSVRKFHLGPVEAILRIRSLTPEFSAEIRVPRSYARWIIDVLVETGWSPHASYLWRTRPAPS